MHCRSPSADVAVVSHLAAHIRYRDSVARVSVKAKPYGVTQCQVPPPGGVTALCLLTESHLSLHPYSEKGVATIDLYCCRPRPAWIRTVETKGESAAAVLLHQPGGMGEIARDLAYRLYAICERKKWADEALAYNGLVIAWSELSKLALAERGKTKDTQQEMF